MKHKATKNRFYTTCNKGHRFHISWPFCPDCTDEWIAYHEDIIRNARKGIARHEAELERLRALPR